MYPKKTYFLEYLHFDIFAVAIIIFDITPGYDPTTLVTHSQKDTGQSPLRFPLVKMFRLMFLDVLGVPTVGFAVFVVA